MSGSALTGQTPSTSIVMIASAALLGALGSHLYKSGADGVSGSALSYLTSIRLLLGMACT